MLVGSLRSDATMAQQIDRWDTRCPNGDTPEGDCQSTNGTEPKLPTRDGIGAAIDGIEREGSTVEVWQTASPASQAALVQVRSRTRC